MGGWVGLRDGGFIGVSWVQGFWGWVVASCKLLAKVNMRNTDAIGYLRHDMICKFAWDLGTA